MIFNKLYKNTKVQNKVSTFKYKINIFVFFKLLLLFRSSLNQAYKKLFSNSNEINLTENQLFFINIFLFIFCLLLTRLSHDLFSLFRLSNNF